MEKIEEVGAGSGTRQCVVYVEVLRWSRVLIAAKG